MMYYNKSEILIFRDAAGKKTRSGAPLPEMGMGL